MLDAGFGSVVLETGGGLIFRVARTAEAAAGHGLELRLLPALADALPAAVPAPEWRVVPGEVEALPFGAIGYPKLDGVPLSHELLERRNLIAADIAEFLHALHRLRVDDAEELGVPRAADWRDTLAALEAEVMPALAQLVTSEEERLLRRWLLAVAGERELDHYRPTLCHRDLWYENLLVAGDPLRLTAVLDWEAAHIGDPAQDLDVHRYLGESFAAAVLAEYGPSEAGFLRRVRRFWELREFAGLRWALRHKDAEELEDALAKLRAGPILAPPARRTL